MSYASKMDITDCEFHAVFVGPVEFDPAKNESNIKKAWMFSALWGGASVCLFWLVLAETYLYERQLP